MTQVNPYEAKTNLSALVEKAAAGEEIVIAKNGKARARLVPMPEETRRPIRFGRYDHLGFELPKDFDDPIPELETRLYGDVER